MKLDISSTAESSVITIFLLSFLRIFIIKCALCAPNNKVFLLVISVKYNQLIDI